MNTYSVSFHGVFGGGHDVGQTTVNKLDAASVKSFINLALAKVVNYRGISDNVFNALHWNKMDTIWEAYSDDGKHIIILLNPEGV